MTGRIDLTQSTDITKENRMLKAPFRVARTWPGPLLALGVIAALLAAPLVALGASSRTIEFLADSFSPKTISVEAGTTLIFLNTSALPHTATADDGSFDTGMVGVGASKSITLTKPGTIAFHCQFHGAVGGVGQSGTITVTAASGTPAPSAKAGVGFSNGTSNPAPPSSATLPDLPEGSPSLPVLAFGVAAVGSILVALMAELVRGAARRRPGR